MWGILDGPQLVQELKNERNNISHLTTQMHSVTSQNTALLAEVFLWQCIHYVSHCACALSYTHEDI